MRKKQRKLDWADLACQEAMDRTLKYVVIPEVFKTDKSKSEYDVTDCKNCGGQVYESIVDTRGYCPKCY